MRCEWSAECGADDPVLVVPWNSPDGALHWVDLRDNPDALDAIPEADEYPAMLAALRALNGTRSPIFTAKCDAWAMESEELEWLRTELMLDAEVAQAGFASYIDLLWRERAVFTSRHRMEGMLYRIERMAAELPHALAALQCVLRPAVTDLDDAVAEGFAITVYVRAAGVDEAEAAQRWDAALRDVSALLRSRELAGA